MSVIKVWNGDGRWSEEIHGLDKVYFIKAAILSAYAPEGDTCKLPWHNVI